MANPNPSPATRFSGVRQPANRRPPDPLTSALRAQVTPERAAELAEALWSRALAGEAWAVREVFDRLEGKPVQRNEHGEPGDFELTLDQARKVLQLDDHRPA